MKTLLKLFLFLLKIALVLIAAGGTAAALFGPDEIMSGLDGESFPGCTAVIAIALWMVMLRLLFGGRRKKKSDTRLPTVRGAS